MATKLGSGYIDLTVHYKDALKQVRRAFDEINDTEIDVDANTSGATANMGRWRAKETAKPVNVRVDVDTRMASRQVSGLRRDLESLGRSDFLKINLAAGGIAGLPAMAAGIAEVAASLQQLSQAALAIPGGIAGVVSSVGTLAFGLTGVADAYEALNKAADDQAKSGRDVANQARAQQSASYGLRNAIVDEKQARQDIARAVRDERRERQDLDLQMRGGVVSEKRAILEAQKARERLYSGDFSDYREALLDVEEADLRVEEVRSRNVRTAEDLFESNSKAVEHSDRVVAANERLIRSQQGVVTAQGAVAAAAETTSAAQETADLAMGKLSANGQKFVNALMDVSGPVQTLRNMVQDRIFDGLDTELRDLAGDAMPTFERGLGGIGDAWNRTFKEMFRLAGQGKNLSILERIFGNTKTAQDIATKGLEPLTDGLLTLTEAGSDALPRLADGFVAVSERFANFITQADEDGRLAEWIDEGITAVGHLGEVALNLGKIFTGIGNATTGSLLGNLEKWTTKWANWINSVEGQQTLRDFFAEGARVFEQWRPVLEDLPGIFRSIYDAASTFSSAVSTILSPITEILKDFPVLVEAAGLAFLVFKSVQVVGAVAELATKLTGISTLLGTDLPKSADKGGKGIIAAFGKGSLPFLALWGLYELMEKITDNPLGRKMLEDVEGEKQRLKDRVAAGEIPGAKIDPVTGEITTLNGGKYLPGANGQSVLDSILTGDVPQFEGGSARQFAHDRMIPFWEGKGFTVGDHAADKHGEHQNGAIDIMVGSTEEGDAILQQVLSDPNVYGAIWNQTSYGYGNGTAGTPMEDRGSPTQNHKDHVHVWYKPGGENNIAPVPPLPPKAPATPPSVAAPGGIPGLFPAPPAGMTPQTVDDLFRPPRKFDTGGWWPDGVMGVNTTGEDELVLNPDHLANLEKQGVDPNALIHGNLQGALPGPPPEAVDQMKAKYGDPEKDMAGLRTGGYIPAAAGSTSVAGTSFLSSLYGMGAEVINGFIDQAASAASTAAAAGLAAGTMGAGAAGAPAAAAATQAAIGMGTQAIKRGVDYGAQMLGIFTDATIEQLTPFGAPRLLTTDPTGFMPQQLLSGAVAKMAGQQPTEGQGQPGTAPAQAPAEPHQGNGAAPGAAPGPQPGVGQGIGQAQAPVNDLQTLDFLKPIIPTIHDQGGWLPAGGVAMNLTKKAEPMPVFNHDQWGTLNAIANSPVAEPNPTSGGDYRMVFEAGSITVKDVAEFERTMQQRQALNTMRYRGRSG